MGDYYDFEFKSIDGEVKAGFVYSNENTGWNEVFVEFASDQLIFANDWQQRANNLDGERKETIKKWLGL